MSYIVDTAGERAEVISINDSQAHLRLSDGRTVLVPRSLLSAQTDGSFRISHSLHGLVDNEVVVVPVIEEELQVGTREVESGVVRVRKTVSEENVVVDEPLRRETVEVERVPINQVISTPAVVREEGDTTIIPVMEEVIVVEKRLMLREEIRITRRQTETHEPQTYIVRREEVTVERVDGDE
jgi:uncharacterized protein (TIGR02271 family)